MKLSLLRLSSFIFVISMTPGVRAQTASPSLAVTYKPAADKLISAALADQEGYADLAYLCDHIGNRVSGSDQLQRAIAWAAETMKKDGLANVTVQPVKVNHWIRGSESAYIEDSPDTGLAMYGGAAATSTVSPGRRRLHMLGLGNSVGTPAEGITAEVAVVPDFQALERLGKAGVQGKIVVYNAPYEGYGRTVQYRVNGPSQAAKLGAVAVLVRSITPLAASLPHTGTLVYDESVAKIPAAAIAPEEAMLLARLTATPGSKPVRVHLAMEAHFGAEVEAANIYGDLVGSEHPEQVVDVGGHIDSWDVGQGAQDDGSGIMAALAAVNTIKRAGLQPKRTVRVVFWVNEENGGAGGREYRKALVDAGTLQDHVAAIEMDGGAETPVGFGYGAPDGSTGGGGLRRARPGKAEKAPQTLPQTEVQSLALLQQVAPLLTRVGATKMTAGGGGSDISPLMAEGVPGLGEMTTGEHYFDWHHTDADTLDKVDPVEFRKNVASLAVMTYVIADMPMRLAGHRGAGEE